MPDGFELVQNDSSDYSVTLVFSGNGYFMLSSDSVDAQYSFDTENCTFEYLLVNDCDAVFIAAHCLGFDIIDNALKSNNVYFDLSSPQLYSADTLRKAYIKYGAERLIFASDAPYGRNNPQIIFDRLEKLWLSQEEFDLITHQNICRILNI